jgi:hypothetical protein
MPNSHDARVEHERGRNLPGDGISQKCRAGRHEDCAAARCQCTDCNHGNEPTTVEQRMADVEQELTEWSEGEDFHAPPISNLRLERKEPSDEITFASLTASLGRRGTGR